MRGLNYPLTHGRQPPLFLEPADWRSSMSSEGCTFIGDWLRVGVQRQRVSIIQQGNVEWISRLLAPALKICGIPQTTVMPSSQLNEFSRQLGNPDLLQSFKESPASTWAAQFDARTNNCFYSILDKIQTSNLIIGFEIPPFLKRQLHFRGTDYVSLHLHPIRFLKDLMFSAYTNSSAIASSLAATSCNPVEVLRQASRYSARFAKLDPPQGRLPEGIPLLLGQTAVDSSLISQGRIVRLHDYKERLETLLHGHNEVAFLKHPLADWDDSSIDLLLNDLGKTVLAISGNSYAHIMTPRELGPVITISSSLGVEAEIFGHDTHFLLTDPREKFATPGLDDERRVELDHRLFEPPLWQQIFARSGEGITSRSQSFYLGANYVRGTLQDSSLQGMEGAEAFPAMEKAVLPARGIPESRVDELAGYLAHAQLRDRNAAAIQAKHHGIDLKFAPTPLKPGGLWEWNSAIAHPELYLAGFHAVEEAGAWSKSLSCAVQVPLEISEDIDVDCEAEISFFSGAVESCPALLVRVEGKPVAASFHFASQSVLHKVLWKTQISASDTCIIQLECSHSARPCDSGISPDERDLGFMLHKLAIHAASAT